MLLVPRAGPGWPMVVLDLTISSAVGLVLISWRYAGCEAWQFSWLSFCLRLGLGVSDSPSWE
jgi:hypothetical protein